jgi:hypothetical protein
VPCFFLSKQEDKGIKHRLITDCRALNAFFPTVHFKLDHLENIFPFLEKGWFAVKVDLRNAYFHM